MKKFEFSLQQVLEYRAQKKKQAASELGRIERQREHIETRLETLAEQWRREKADLNRSLENLVAAEYQMRLSYLDFIDRKMQTEQEKLRAALNELGSARARLLKCSQEEHILEMLRNRKKTKHDDENRRQESAMADEHVNMRTAHRLVQTSLPVKFVQ